MKLSPAFVLDTNTVLALWVFNDPRLARLAACIEAARCRLFSRADALAELADVLTRHQFGLDADKQSLILQTYSERLSEAPAAEETSALPQCQDRDDQKFLEIARDTGATHLLTRDKMLLKLNHHRLIRPCFRIITPERLLAESPKL